MNAGGSSATRLEGFDLRIRSSDRKSKRGTPSGVLSILVLATCILPLAAAPRDCAEKPASTHLVDVKAKGARGDDRTDDTAAIQAAIDEVAGTGGTVLIPDGRYLVDAVGKKRLVLRSDMTLMLANDAVLKAIPNDSGKYAVLSISGVSNVAVVGGTLEGERDEHEGKSGEWGMGIQIHRGAKHITISGVTVRKMWGDGFYVKGAKDVKFCFVTADNNRRQGLSIVEADGVVVTDSVFKNTRGTRPGAGIDLEPNKPGQRISSVRIQNSKFLDNAGAGIQIGGKKGAVKKVELSRNVFKGNRPFLVEDAPSVVASAICNNRQITRQEAASGGLNAFIDPIEMVIHQNDCEEGRDPRFEVNRQRRRSK